MSKAFKLGIVGLLVAGLLVMALAGSVLAQEAPPTPTPKAFGYRGWGHGPKLCGQAGLEAAAEMLGMTAEELSNQLWAGESLADLADEAGVDLQELRDAVEAACQEARREAIAQAIDRALEAGRITEDMANWLREGLENGYLDRGGFFGFGHGFGHGRGFKGHFGPGHGFRRDFGRGPMREGVPTTPSAIVPDSSA